MQRAGYRHLDAAVLRGAALTVHVPEFWPDLDQDDEDDDEDAAERACAWLKNAWSRPELAEAVAIASPVLAARIGAVCAGRRLAMRQVRRMVISLARYLVRVRGRATPFGVFAGVTPLRFGSALFVEWNGAGRARYRADARWLAVVVATLESSGDVRERLTMRLNDLAYVRGRRLIIPWQPHLTEADGVHGEEVSLRDSPAVRMVRQVACSPIRLADLRAKVATEFPNASPESIDRMLRELMTRGVLISNLRPRSTIINPLGHVLAELDAVGADSIEAAAPLVRRLRAVHAELAVAGRCGLGGGVTPRGALRDRMREVSDVVEQPLMVDLALSAEVVLPEQVAREAAIAAGALMRLTPHPSGTKGWREYHERFLARYGIGAVVPVGDLVDATTGLGFPAHFTEAEPVARALSRRDEMLLSIAQQAALDGAREISLDDGVLDQIAGDESDHQVPHADLCAEVHASSRDALAAGAFQLVLTGAGRSAVSLTGRFLDLLSEENRDRMQGEYNGLPTGVEGALTAQLSFPPRALRTDNVARTPRIAPYLISLAEYRGSHHDVIPLDELAVTANAHRMYLLSMTRRRIIEPLITNATARHTWPLLARLLFELPRARAAAIAPFAWGAAGCLPYLPGLRFGRTVLSRARWRIPAKTLPGPGESHSVWTDSVVRLRDRLELPRWVSVGDFDRRLVLNLTEPMDRDLLRAHVDTAARAGEPAVLTEAAAPEDYGWLGRAHEIVVPLASTAVPAPAPTVVTRPCPVPLIDREHGVLPGGNVVFAKVYGHPDGVPEILTRHLPELLAELRDEWGEPPRWWFVRYRDPAPHLRFRFHLPANAAYGATAARIGTWAAGLRRCGLAGELVFDTYYPEIARYGNGACMAAAESLFVADSEAVVAQLGLREIDPVTVTAPSMIDLAAGITGGRTDGMRWLLHHVNTRVTSTEERSSNARAGRRERLEPALVRQASERSDPQATGLRALRGGAAVAAAWVNRRQAAAAYADHLNADYDAAKQDSVITSLLHLHHVRGHGIDAACEQRCLRLARAVAVSWAARRGDPKEPAR